MSAVPAEDLILISVDDHICEPEDMFTRHVPARWLDQAPRVVEEENGVQQWYYGNVRGRNLGRDLVAAPYQEQQRRQRRAGHSLGGLRELLADVVVADRRVCAYAHGRHRRAGRRLADRLRVIAVVLAPLD